MQDLLLPSKSDELQKIQFYKFYSDFFSTIDGFEKEGNPCVIILNQPKIGNGSFAGIKPSVIIFSKVPVGYNTNLIDLK